MLVLRLQAGRDEEGVPNEEKERTLMSVLEALEGLRKQRGWSRRYLCGLIHMQPSHYTEFTQGRRPLPYRVICRLHELNLVSDKILLSGKMH